MSDRRLSLLASAISPVVDCCRLWNPLLGLIKKKNDRWFLSWTVPITLITNIRFNINLLIFPNHFGFLVLHLIENHQQFLLPQVAVCECFVGGFTALRARGERVINELEEWLSCVVRICKDACNILESRVLAKSSVFLSTSTNPYTSAFTPLQTSRLQITLSRV